MGSKMTKQEQAHWESLIGRSIENPNEFLIGQMDCKEGGSAGFRDGFGEDYERGFWTQYQLDELKVDLNG